MRDNSNIGKTLQGNSVWRVSFVAAFFVASLIGSRVSLAQLIDNQTHWVGGNSTWFNQANWSDTAGASPHFYPAQSNPSGQDLVATFGFLSESLLQSSFGHGWGAVGNPTMNSNTSAKGVEFWREFEILGSGTLSVGSHGLHTDSATGASGLRSDIRADLNITADQDWFIDTKHELAIQGNISGAFNRDIAIKSGGKVSFSGNNDFAGVITIDNGTLQLLGGDNLSDAVRVDIGDNGLLDLLNTSETFGSLVGRGQVDAFGDDMRVGVNNEDFSYDGLIQGSANIIKAGTGEWSLAGNNAYSGDTIVEAGTLNILTGNVLPNTRLTIHPGATVRKDGNIDTSESVGSLDGAGGNLVLLNNAEWKVGADNSNTTFSGAISGEGRFTKIGSGTLIFGGDNTAAGFAGSVEVHDGSLNVQNNGKFLVTETATLGIDNDHQANSRISGAGSEWHVAGTLTVGKSAPETGQIVHALVVDNGGNLISEEAVIGNGTTTHAGMFFDKNVANVGSVTVSGNGSVWQVSGSLGLGEKASFTKPLISFGGGLWKGYFIG